MLTENTITKLQQMRLSAMANAFREQQLDPNMVSLSFEDRFGLLVDQDAASSSLATRTKNAGMAKCHTCIFLLNARLEWSDAALFRSLRALAHTSADRNICRFSFTI